MIIDGHAHACGSYYGSEQIARYMKEHSIDKVLLCGGEPNSTKDYNYPMLSTIFRGNRLGFFFNRIICKVTALHKLSLHIDEQNNYVYDLSTKLPNQILNAYWVNPNEENCIEKMQNFYVQKGFHLIKLHQCWTPFELECDNCHQLFHWANAHAMPVFIHLLSQSQVEAFVKMANLYPDTTFIVAHMIGAEYMADKLNNKNVYFDLSAPQLYSMRILKKALNSYGAKRLLLGSDTPYGKNNIESNIKRLKKLNLSETEFDAITGDNLMKLLRL